MTRQTYASLRSLRSGRLSHKRRSAQAYRERRFSTRPDDPVVMPPTASKAHTQIGLGLVAIALLTGLGVVAWQNHPSSVQEVQSPPQQPAATDYQTVFTEDYSQPQCLKHCQTKPLTQTSICKTTEVFQ